MTRGALSAASVEQIQACTRDETLARHEVAFGKIIYYTNPPCIDCTWPGQHDADVRARLSTLGATYRPAANPKKTYTVTYKETGHHELDLDCLRSGCRVTGLDCTESRPGVWQAVLHEGSQRRNNRALYGFEVLAKNITRVEIRCGGISWAKALHSPDRVQVDRPGNMCWPLWLTFYNTTFLNIHGSSKPDLRILDFEADEGKARAYEHGIVTCYDYASEDAEAEGAIARFMSGLSGCLLTTVDKEIIERHAITMRRAAAQENEKTDTERTHTAEVAVVC